MHDNLPVVLVIADTRLTEETIAWIDRWHPDRQIVLLKVSEGGECPILPASWKCLSLLDLLDETALRRDFLDFVDLWPRQPVLDNATFDQLFRTQDGYSLWWTGPGAERHPHRGPFPAMKVLWLTAQAIQRLQPQALVICTRHRPLADCLASQAAAARIEFNFPPSFVQPTASAWSGRLGWFLRSLAWLPRFLLLSLTKAVVVRWLGEAGRSSGTSKSPTIVATALFPQHTRVTENGGKVEYWESVARALEANSSAALILTLPQIDWPELRRRGKLWQKLRELRVIEHLLPSTDHCFRLSACLRKVVRLLGLLLRYFRLEAHPAFQRSFQFCGADVSALYVPYLRAAMRKAIDWEQRVDAAAAVLGEAGEVQAVLVHEEFYAHAGMIFIAACRRLGILTVGVQHGTIYPSHWIYTLPPGQLTGAPTPDYFAAYGDFGREVVSGHGSFPAERVWICGGPRFDPLVQHPPDRDSCRQRLGLPRDRFVLLVTTQGYPWFPTAVRALLDAVREDPRVCLCIKCWQADGHRETYRQLAAEPGQAEVRVYSDQYADLLGACDGLISVSSTTLLEATLLGKPSICLNFSGEPDRYPYVEEGVSLRATTMEEIRQAVLELKRFVPTAAWEERRRTFLTRHLGPTLTGSSAATIAQYLQTHFLQSVVRGSAFRRSENAA